MRLLIKNGRVIDPASNTDDTLDILIEKKEIIAIETKIDDESAKTIDASRMVVTPGFVDMHVHLREPGYEHKETIKTGALAAVWVNQALPEFPPRRGYALQWERIGDQRRLARDHAAALEAYEKALIGDWQDLEPNIKQAETRLRMARTRADAGDFSGADELVREILAGATEEDARTRRLVRDARVFEEKLRSR